MSLVHQFKRDLTTVILSAYSRPMRHMRERSGGLADAIKAADNSITELAARLGLTPQAVSDWNRVPVNRCTEVERVTGIPRERLRPDIFGRKSERAEQAA